MSVLHVPVHAVCLCTCCMPVYSAECPCPFWMSLSMLHAPVHAACTCPCCMPTFALHDMDIPHGHGFAARACSMNVGIQHGHEQAAFNGKCSMGIMDVQHGHCRGHAALTYTSTNSKYFPCRMSLFMLHFYIHVLAACPCPCCMSFSLSMVHDQVHNTCPCPCCMALNMQHWQGHTAWTWKCSINMDIQHGHGQATWLGHAAWTWTCSIDGHVAWTETWACGMYMLMPMQHGNGAFSMCRSMQLV